MINKKIKLILISAALILSVNFSVFAEAYLNTSEEEIQKTDEIVEEYREEVVEELEADNNENESFSDLPEVEEKTRKEIIEIEEKDDTEIKIMNGKSGQDKKIKPEEVDKNRKEATSESLNWNRVEVEVSSWEEFQTAYENQNVEKIIITKDLSGPSKTNTKGFEERETSLTIDGKNHLIDLDTVNNFRSDLFSLSPENTGYLRLENLRVKHRLYNIVSAKSRSDLKWQIILDNVKILSGRQRSVVSGVGIDKIDVINEFNANIPSNTASYSVFDVPNALVELQNGNKVEMNNGITAKNIVIKNVSELKLYFSSSTASNQMFKADNILVENSRIIADIGITLFSITDELNVMGSEINVDTNNRIVKGESGSKASFKKSNLIINTKTDSFYLPKIYFEDTKVNAVTNLSFFNTNSSDFSNDDLLFKVLNSEIDIEANHTSNSVIVLGYGIRNRRGMHMEISGPNTMVNINSKVNSNEKGIINMVGTNTGQGKMNGLYVESGARLNLHSVGGHVIFSRIYEGGQTIIDGPGTELNAKQDIGNGPYLAALRYAYAGNQKLEVSNKASVNVEAGIGTSPAVRMYGNDNKFVVLSGARMRIHNPGNGKGLNPGSDGQNQGIQYQVSDQNTFTVEGSGSSLEIIADYGAAVDAKTGNLDLTVGKDTIFVASGQTEGSNSSIFYAETMNFVTRSPRYYDFANTRKGGGLVVSASSSKVSSYKSILSDFAVWKIGANINGNPHRSWSQFDFELSGSKLQEIVEPKNDRDFNSDESSFGANGLQAYTRISGNNSRPIVDVFPIPFDTDRFIYGHLSVPEGLEGLRNAWTDEVFVDLEETLPNGEVNVYYDLATVGSEDGQVGYPVYDVEESKRGGYFRLDLGEDNLATIGAKYKIIKAYRGYRGIAEEKKIYALEEQLGDSVVVLDKTPPVISTIDSPIYNQQKLIKGYSEEKDVKVSFAINKQTLLKDGKELVIHPDENGQWEMNFEDIYDLQIGDILHVILEDSVGNKNPLEDTKFHDITKKEAAHVVIQESFFVLEAEDTFISVKDFKNIKNDDDLIRLMNASANEKRETVVEHKVGISNRDGLSYELPRSASYAIEFSIVGHEQITLNKKLHILDYDHVEDNDEYVIVANDFYASNLDYKNKDPKFMIEKASAKAFKKDNINKELDVVLDSGQLGSAAKEYKIAFAVKDDLSIKVNVKATVLDKENVGDSKTTVIAANNFSIMSYQVFGLSDEAIIEFSKAQAWEKDESGVISNPVGVDMIKHNVQVEPGRYTARLKVK